MAARRPAGKHGGKRAGAGRPATLEDPIRFLVSFEKRDIEALEEIADDQDRSVASLVRQAVSAFLKRRRR